MSEPGFLERTRASYDAVATDYAEWARNELAVKPMDRAVLGAFAELVLAHGGPVADIGCGPGRVTTYLDSLGVPAFGVDLSPEMIAVARRTHPELRFEVGSMLDLDLDDGTLGGILAWYSVIHIPAQRRPDVFAGFHKALAPGGYLQLAFQVGDEPMRLTDARGHQVSLDFHRLRPEQVTESLRNAGFAMQAQLVREPDDAGEFPESTPQGFLLARKPF